MSESCGAADSVGSVTGSWNEEREGGMGGSGGITESLVHFVGCEDSVVELLDDIAYFRSGAAAHRSEAEPHCGEEAPTAEAGGSYRKFHSPAEYQSFVSRVQAGKSKARIQKVFLYKGSACNVEKEIWFEDKENPAAEQNPLKAYAVVHVHYHASVQRLCDLMPSQLDYVDAVNVRHFAPPSGGPNDYSHKCPFFDTDIEEWGQTVFPTNEWACKSCGASNWANKVKCRGCHGKKPCYPLEWRKGGVGSNILTLLTAADASLPWRPGNPKHERSFAHEDSSGVVSEFQIESLRTLYATRGNKGKELQVLKTSASMLKEGAKSGPAQSTPSIGQEQHSQRLSIPPYGKLNPHPPPADKLTVLFLGANNRDAVQLSLKEECEQMRMQFMWTLGSEALRDKVRFVQDCLASADELPIKISEERPTILHLGCHGDESFLRFFGSTAHTGSLVQVIRNHQKACAPADQIRLAIANACMSYELAHQLSDSIDFVIGHQHKLGDAVALKFTRNLYRFMGKGELSLKHCFENAKIADLGEFGTYFLFSARVNPDQFFFLPAGGEAASTSAHQPAITGIAASPETEEDKKLSQLPWKEVVAWFHRINIHPHVIAILEEDKVSGAQLARMDLKELMEDLEMRKLQAQRVLMRENIFETIIHATAHALSESLSNDSYLSDVYTEEAVSSGDESQDGLDGWDTIAAKHPGQPEDFRDHMRGLVTELREFMSIAHEGSEAEHVDLDFGGGNSWQWTYCMLLWLQFAKEASTDEPSRKRWLACVGHGCSQDLLLQELGEWLQQPQTCHPDWSLASFSQLRCEKQHAACVFITDRNVQRQLEAFPLSRQVWTKSVVSEWFANDEPASAFLSRANRFLQRHPIEGMEVLDKVIPTHSYVAFMFATKLAAQLLFAYLEARSISTPAASSAGATAFALHGFSAFVSSDKSSFVAPGSLQPSSASKAVVLQGLRCLSHLALSQRDLLGPIRPLVEFVADGAVQQSGHVQSPGLGKEQQDAQLSVQSSGGPSLNEQEVQALVQVLLKQAGIWGAMGLGQLEGKQQSEDVPAAFNPPLDAAMAKLEGLLSKQGPVYRKGLERGLELISRKAGAVERSEFDTVLGFCGVSLGEEEASTVFRALDRGDLVVGCAELVQSGCPLLLSPRIEACLRGVLETDSAEKKPDESGCNLRFLLQFSSLVLPKHSMAPDEQGAAGATKATEQARKRLGLPDRELLHNYLQDSVSQTEKCVDSATGEMLDIEGHFNTLKAIEKRSLWGECDASEEARQKDLTCPITLSIMDDPVLLSGGGETETKCYERGEITRWMQQKGTSPQSRRRFDSWKLVPAGDKKEEITAYIKGMQEKLLGREQQMEGEEERQLMLHRKGYAASRAIDPRSESKMVRDEDILKDCCSGEKAFCVIGPPASGKTTTMLRIATVAAKHALADESALIPLFLRATKLASLLSESAQEADQVVDFVEFYIRHAPQLQTARSVLLSLYRQGQLLVIMDGLDEAGVYRSAIERFLEPLAAQHSVGGFQGNQLLLSTRTSSYTESRVWLRLTKFVPLEIQPLDETMARAIIHDRIGNDAQEEVLWRDLQTVAKNNPQLLANPFLLCLVVSIFKQSGSIPSQRGELYQLSVEGMVRRSLSTAAPAKTLHPEERMKVDMEQAVQFLQCVAFVCHLGESPTRDFVLDDTFMALVRDRWTNHLGLSCELVPVLKTALVDEALCGVFTRVAGGKKRFSHLTQQEFLAACHIVHCAARSSDPARQVLDTLSRFSILDPWIREVLLHCACLLRDGAFVQFCSLILENEDGTIAHSEIVKDLMAERGASEEVSTMLEQKFQALRPIADVVAALCHPSCDLRERAITELQSFSFSAGHAFVTNVSNQLASVVRNEKMGLFARRAALLSLVQLCDDRSSVDIVCEISELLVWCLSEEGLYEVAVKGLGTLEAGSSNGHREVAAIMLKRLARGVRAEVVQVAGALADLKLTPPQLVFAFANFLNKQSPNLCSSLQIPLYLEVISNSDALLVHGGDDGSDTTKNKASQAYLRILLFSFSVLSSAASWLDNTETIQVWWTTTHQLLRKFELQLSSGSGFAAEMEIIGPLVGQVAQRGLLKCSVPGMSWVVKKICSACTKIADDLEEELGSPGQRSWESEVAERLKAEGFWAVRAGELRHQLQLSEQNADAVRDSDAAPEPLLEPNAAGPGAAAEAEAQREGVCDQTLRGWDQVIGEAGQESRETGIVGEDGEQERQWRASCDALWKLSFEGFDAVQGAQEADPDVHAFLHLKFGDPPLELNSRRWANYVIEVMSMKNLGRYLFSSILRHVESTFREDPARSAQALRPLLEALSSRDPRKDASSRSAAAEGGGKGGDAVQRQIGLETRHLLKELQVGCRCDTRSLWGGEIVSYKEAGEGTGGEAHGSTEVGGGKKETPQPVRLGFSSEDLQRLLVKDRDGKTKLRVIGFTEFPDRKAKTVERQYWLELDTSDASLAGHDGLAILSVRYAGKWKKNGEQQDRSVITQINLRRTVPHETATPGVNAQWKKCKDLDKWMEIRGVEIFKLPSAGWRWREQRGWDNGFAPVIHDLLMVAEQCTRRVQ